MIRQVRAKISNIRASGRKASAMFYRDAALAISYDVSFLFSWVGILVQVVSFYFISKLILPSAKYGYAGHTAGYFSYVLVNLAFARFQATAVQCFQSAIRDDQLTGTLEAILATPTSLGVVILSRGLWAFTLTSLQVGVFMLMGAMLGLHFDDVNIVTVLTFVVLTVACMSPLGVMSAAGIMTFKQASGTGFIMGGLTQLLGGILFPVSALPTSLQYVSWLLPITHALNGIRAGMHGASLYELGPDIAWLSVAAMALLPFSLWTFARAVRRAQIDGTLGQY